MQRERKRGGGERERRGTKPDRRAGQAGGVGKAR